MKPSSHSDYESLRSTAAAAQAAGLSEKKVATWLACGAFQLDQDDVDPGGKGRPRQWSLASIQRLAVVAELTRFGVSPSRAAAVAQQIMHRADFHDDSAPL